MIYAKRFIPVPANSFDCWSTIHQASLSLSLQDVMEKVTERATEDVTARESENAQIVAEGARAQERKKRFQQFKNFFGARF